MRLQVQNLLGELSAIQESFFNEYRVNDIYSNSKIFEIVIANSLNHNLIPGHSGSRNGRDENSNEYEYKHYKETSSNHSWTFNDFSDRTISKLELVKGVVFAHINDLGSVPTMDWCFIVPGKLISDYLKEKTIHIINKRKMINVSPQQLQSELHVEKTVIKANFKGRYDTWLQRIFQITSDLENLTGVKGILTSNKLWEILISIKLHHKVQSEQAAHDAVDAKGNYFEYKISKTLAWNFQDISDNVLEKYLRDKAIILCVVDKQKFKVIKAYSAEPKFAVARLKEKLHEKRLRFKARNKELRRLQVSLSRGDLKKIHAVQIL